MAAPAAALASASSIGPAVQCVPPSAVTTLATPVNPSTSVGDDGVSGGRGRSRTEAAAVAAAAMAVAAAAATAVAVAACVRLGGYGKNFQRFRMFSNLFGRFRAFLDVFDRRRVPRT